MRLTWMWKKLCKYHVFHDILEVYFCLTGYLRYKTITSQNVLSEPQVRNFLFHRKFMFRSQDIQVFYIVNHLMIYQISDVMMSIRK